MDFAAVGDFVKAAIAEESIPGAAVLVNQGGEPVFEEYFGVYPSSIGENLAYGPRVKGILYSYTKGITVSVVAMAKQEGLLDYDRPVVDYIPEFSGGGKDAITLRHLLCHAAGIPAVPIGPVGTDEQWQAAVDALCAAETAWPPGSRCEYHGLTGPFMAAELVRRVYARAPWPEICRNKLFAPLGADSMTMEVPAPQKDISLTPPNLTQLEGNPFAGHPGGACFGTPADALKVLQLHNNGGIWDGKVLLKPETLREIHTVQYADEIEAAYAANQIPAHQSWGLGWLLRGKSKADGVHSWFGFHDQESPTIFGHAGIDTVMGIGDPATNTAIMFVCTASPPNEEKATELRNGVTNRVMEALNA